MLVIPANCRRTFLLSLLNKIQSTFTNPASNSSACENAEVVFLTTFIGSSIHCLARFTPARRSTSQHLPAPKLHFTFKGDMPTFCTTTRPLNYIKNGCLDYRETEMMSVRWNVLNLAKQIPQSQLQDLEACSLFFARLILQVEDC